MAIVRQTLAEHAGGLVVFWMEWDNLASRRYVTAVGCTNNSDENAYAEAYRADDGTRKQSAVFLAHTDTSIAVPTGQAQRLQLVINPTHNLPDGIQFMTAWPSPV